MCAGNSEVKTETLKPLAWDKGWHVEEGSSGHYVAIKDGNGRLVAKIPWDNSSDPHDGDRANLIVRAVNSHEALLEAAKELKNQLYTLRAEANRHKFIGNERTNLVAAALFLADKAIAKAEGAHS